jgi:hypothetical protein
LAAWWPTIKAGGVMAGHDYDGFWAGVVRAVDGFFGHDCRDPLCPNCWSVVKPAGSF